MILIIKYKMICVISLCKIQQNTRPFDIDYRIKKTLFRKPLQFNAVGVVPLIAQGWRQPTLGYACSEEVNAVGVVHFLRGMPR